MCILGYFATENNKQIYRGDRTQQDTTWHLGKCGTEQRCVVRHLCTEWDNPPHRFQTGWCWSPISGSYLGYWACRIYIYRGMVGPLWIHITYFCLGRGLEITGKTLFFLVFFYFPQSTLIKDVCILLLMKPAFYFWTYFLFKHLFGFP